MRLQRLPQGRRPAHGAGMGGPQQVLHRGAARRTPRWQGAFLPGRTSRHRRPLRAGGAGRRR
eukprot:2523198-Lingulodinium_polyedra.AAC.1